MRREWKTVMRPPRTWLRSFMIGLGRRKLRRRKQQRAGNTGKALREGRTYRDAQNQQGSQVDQHLLPSLLNPLADLQSLLAGYSDVSFLPSWRSTRETWGFLTSSPRACCLPCWIATEKILPYSSGHSTASCVTARSFVRSSTGSDPVQRAGSGSLTALKRAFSEWLNNAPVERLLASPCGSSHRSATFCN